MRAGANNRLLPQEEWAHVRWFISCGYSAKRIAEITGVPVVAVNEIKQRRLW